MRELRYTLVSDGSSDRALLPILTWLLDEHRVRCPIQAEWADLRRLPSPPKNLAPRIEKSLELYPCDLLFVHRDAENRSYDQRRAEIDGVLATIGLTNPPSVCVVPVRMLEAWLLFDEAALRRASQLGLNRYDLMPLLDDDVSLRKKKYNIRGTDIRMFGIANQ